jgi:hypothetical protein
LIAPINFNPNIITTPTFVVKRKRKVRQKRSSTEEKFQRRGRERERSETWTTA